MQLKDKNIKFKKHFYDRVNDRPISEEMVRFHLKKTDNLLNVEEQSSKRQGENKFKLWIKLSNRYSLVVIAAISREDLYIITAWNTNRKWQKTKRK